MLRNTELGELIETFLILSFCRARTEELSGPAHQRQRLLHHVDDQPPHRHLQHATRQRQRPRGAN